jgi:branched-chain amino acid transport system permease protein
MLCIILLVRPGGLFGDMPRRRLAAAPQQKPAVDESSAGS